MRVLVFAALVVVAAAAKNRGVLSNKLSKQLARNIPAVDVPSEATVEFEDSKEQAPVSGELPKSSPVAAPPPAAEVAAPNVAAPPPPAVAAATPSAAASTPSPSVPDPAVFALESPSPDLRSNSIEGFTLGGPYEPNWPSIDSRPVPSWYDDAKVGIFIHWGVYSVPSFSSEWFWIDWKGKPSPNPKAQKKIEHFMKANYKPGFTYQDFAKDFTAEFFDPSRWADIIENSGAKYVVFTSKHHEGYALWPSKYSYSWNSVDVGPHRDLIGDLRRAILKKKGIRFGLYHSLYEWFHPLYLSDKSNNFTTQEFVNHKIYLEMKELVNLYKPDVFWSDGEWEAPSEYWRSTEFLAWLYNKSPVKDRVVVNDRWGKDTLCKHGGMFTCQDRYNPGKLLQHKWENAMTIDKNSWGFNRVSNLGDYMTTQDLIDELASTVSCGGNIVMNVGPAKDGTINPIFQDRLSGVGKWLKINGEAIYGSRPWDKCQNDTLTSNVWYTVNKDATNLYAVMLRWPGDGVLDLACPVLTAESQVFLLDIPATPLKAERKDNVLRVTLPDKARAQTDWGSVVKIVNFDKTTSEEADDVSRPDD